MGTLASLRSGDTISFTRLQELIGLTPGNLITHLRKLEVAGYIATEKSGNGSASLTTAVLTTKGRQALDAYRDALKGMLEGL
jgi:DNA-binding MarR family transcriptional regulator